MRDSLRMFLRALLWVAVPFATVSQPVSVTSLLGEMTDPDAVTYRAERPWTTRLWSSCDRASVAPNRPGWFANNDRNQFVRDETNAAGKVEHVLLDAKGPGAIVRFWMTFDRVPDGGLLRIYVDGKKEVEGKGFEILSGRGLCGAPLAASVSERSPLAKRGHDLYLPIPYATSCKVTLEAELSASACAYYNVETRTYPADTPVESFSRAALAAARADVEAANAALAARIDFPLPKGVEAKALKDVPLKACEEQAFSFAGPGAIREIALDVNFGVWSPNQPMPEEIFIVVDCDGERTVEVPAIAFFGTGSTLRDFNTRFTAKCGGVMKSRWVMPFKTSARVAVRGGKYAVPLRSFSVTAGAYDWQESRSLHFRSSWTPYRQIPTRQKGDHRDLNYLTVKGGAGRLVGCGLSIANPANIWWGEGDEKIFVDGEAVPSYIGTGTEDHYGYAWCRGEEFSHPFLAQPDGRGNMSPGVSVNLRHRVLDAVEFTRSLVFDMELWHWRDCRVDYDAWCWYYFR